MDCIHRECENNALKFFRNKDNEKRGVKFECKQDRIASRLSAVPEFENFERRWEPVIHVLLATVLKTVFARVRG